MITVQLQNGGPISEMEEALLEKRVDVVDNENEYTTSVEYCLAGCSGRAHQTGNPDAPSFFCSHHVHRSAHVTLKRPMSAFGEIESFK